jgi:hypothetical protein
MAALVRALPSAIWCILPRSSPCTGRCDAQLLCARVSWPYFHLWPRRTHFCLCGHATAVIRSPETHASVEACRPVRWRSTSSTRPPAPPDGRPSSVSTEIIARERYKECRNGAASSAFSLVVGVLLLWLFVLPRWLGRVVQTAPGAPTPSSPKHDSKPFAGSTHTPECAFCAPGMDLHPQAPNALPPRLLFTRGRRRSIDTTSQCCPQAACAYCG